MSTREQFGRYLLLKKLGEDGLGEYFRAGQIGSQGIDQVLLLRVFNGAGIAGPDLWASMSARALVQQALRNPTIGVGVDMGEVRGIPYVAYDYVSGKNLATLVAQADQQLSPLPTDHALLIAERLAQALMVAHETRVEEERVLHGCVVPQLVVLSNEGETRLLGFEAGPGLRPFVARGDLGRYLSPEARSGQPIHKSDDAYSLGAILLELLTGEKLPASPPGGFEGLIDGATLASEGTPLSDPLKNLLMSSLASREQRVGDAPSWHRALSRIMADGAYNPTTFNLAFFMHNLFRDEIEREGEEIAAEKTLEIPTLPPAAASGPVPPGVEAGRTPDFREDTKAVREEYGIAADEKRSRKGLFVALAAVVAVAVIAGGLFLFLREKPVQEEASEVAQMEVPTQQPVAPVQQEPAGPTPEEIQAQIEGLVQDQVAGMAEELKAGYEQELAQLKAQLQEAEIRARREAEAAAAAQAQPVPTPEVKTPTAEEEAPPEAGQSAPKEVEEGGEVAGPGDSQDETETESPTAEEPAEEIVAKPPPPKVKEVAKVKVGDLVQAGPGVTGPKLKTIPPARFPRIAQRMNRREATVHVLVLVDENGRVIEQKLKGEKVGFGFDEEALNVSGRATFEPGTKEGVRVKMWVSLPIRFQT